MASRLTQKACNIWGFKIPQGLGDTRVICKGGYWAAKTGHEIKSQDENSTQGEKRGVDQTVA